MASKHSARFGELVRSVLREKGLKYRDASDITGVSTTAVYDMSQGRIPKPETIRAFAAGLNIDPEPLLEEARKAMFPELEPPSDPFEAMRCQLRKAAGELTPEEQDAFENAMSEEWKRLRQKYKPEEQA